MYGYGDIIDKVKKLQRRKNSPDDLTVNICLIVVTG
jgi:hypothetical protein